LNGKWQLLATTGYKLLYKNGTSVQELFVVCDREKFLEEFKATFLNP
jgi:hypothetical protein